MNDVALLNPPSDLKAASDMLELVEEKRDACAEKLLGTVYSEYSAYLVVAHQHAMLAQLCEELAGIYRREAQQ